EKNQQVQQAANDPLTPTLSRREREEDFPSPPGGGRGQGEGGDSTGERQKHRAYDQKPRPTRRRPREQGERHERREQGRAEGIAPAQSLQAELRAAGKKRVGDHPSQRRGEQN